MENNNVKLYKGVVVRDFQFKRNSTEPLEYPYGFIHPLMDNLFDQLRSKDYREISNFIKTAVTANNIQFILPTCQVPAAQEACANNDNAQRGDLVTFTLHTGNNGFSQARDVKVVRKFGANPQIWYAEESIKEEGKRLVKGTAHEEAVNILFEELGDDIPEEEEYSDEEYDQLDDQDNIR